MRHYRSFILAAFTALACTNLYSADVPGTGRKFEGVLSQITATVVTLDGNKSFKLDTKKAKCFDVGGNKTTCETLIGVGYADKARITVIGDVVERIDILDLQQ